MYSRCVAISLLDQVRRDFRCKQLDLGRGYLYRAISEELQLLKWWQDLSAFQANIFEE